MSLDETTLNAILGVVESHALSSGYFDAVNGHEPLSPPTTGVTCAVWVEEIGPARGGSGLDSTSARLALFVRLYTPMAQLPTDAIDPAMMAALNALFVAYSGDFTLGGLIREVDLLGRYGTPLSGRAGYIKAAGADFRVFTITLPLIVNDCWEQVAQ